MAPRIDPASGQVTSDVYRTGGGFGGGDFSNLVNAPLPPPRPPGFDPTNATATTNLSPNTYGLGASALQPPPAFAPAPPSPGPGHLDVYSPPGQPPPPPVPAPYTAPYATPGAPPVSPAAGTPTYPYATPGAPPVSPNPAFPPASSLPGPGHLDVYGPGPPVPSPGPAHLSVYSPPAQRAPVPGPGAAQVALPPRRPASAPAAAAPAQAPARAPYPPAQPIAHVAGPNWLRNLVLAGQPAPGARPTVGNTMASMLMNRGQGGGMS